jgi:hypothetical protein
MRAAAAVGAHGNRLSRLKHLRKIRWGPIWFQQGPTLCEMRLALERASGCPAGQNPMEFFSGGLEVVHALF